MSASTIIETLTDWSTRLAPDDIPYDAVHAARRSLLDTIGVMLAAAPHPLTRKVAAVVAEQYGTGDAQAIGLARPVSAVGAALANGTAAHVLDFDDTSYTGIMHGAAISIPAILAAAQHTSISGDDFLTALIAGLEATYVLATIITPQAYTKGWWTSGTAGIPGATLGVARALNLSREQTIDALGIATVEAFGSRAMFGKDAKPHLSGRAAAAAVSAGFAARSGVTANADAFEHDRGFLALMTNGTIIRDGINALGNTWRQVDPGILYKRFPVCSAAHASIEAIETLKAEYSLNADEITSIDCEVPNVVAISLIYDDPQSTQAAQFSLPYTVACMMVHGELTYRHLGAEFRHDTQVQNLRTKITTRIADDLASDPSTPEGVRMTVRTCTGATHKLEIRAPKGMPQNPLSDHELTAKFQNCGQSAGLSSSRLATLADDIWTITQRPAMRGLLPDQDEASKDC